MEIIGKTGDGFIATVSMREIARIAGFRSEYDDGFKEYVKAVGIRRGYHDGVIDVGSVISVEKLSSWHADLLQKEAEAEKAAGMLRSLADMITHSLPSLLVPPAKEADKGPPETKEEAS